MKKILFVFLLLFSLAFVVGCNKEDKPDENVKETLEITETNLTLDEGESYTFNVDVNVVLSSSNNEVILTGEKTITALKEGVAVVTIKLASDESVSKDVTVTVVKNVDILETIETNLTLEEGKEYIFNIEGITLSATDETIVSVSGKTITGLKPGTTIVTVYKSNDSTNFKEVNVVVTRKPSVVDSISNKLYVDVNGEYTFNVEGITVELSNNEYISLTDKTIKGLKAGETTVTVYDNLDNTIFKKVTIVVIEVVTDEEIHNWLTELYEGLEVSEDVNFIEKYKDTNINLYYDCDDKLYLKTTGKFTAPIFDLESNIIVFYDLDYAKEDGKLGTRSYEHSYSILLKGYGNEALATVLELEKFVPEEIEKDYKFPIKYELYSATIEWYYNGELLENGLFVVEEDLADSFYATVKAVVNAKEYTEEKEFTFFVSHLTKKEKVAAIKEDLIARYSSAEVEGNIELIYEHEFYPDSRIAWNSWVPHIITSRGKFTQPLKDAVVYMQATVYVGSEFDMFDVPLTVKGLNPVSTSDKVSAFLDRIAMEEIGNQKFTLYGWESPADGFDGDYRYVPTYNYGYIFFYTNTDLKVTEDIIPLSHAGRPGTIRKSTNYITIHNTGMAHPQSNAEYLNTYIHKDTTREASWHFSIDDKEAYQHLPLNEVGWHAGDGSSQYGGIHYNDTYNKWCINGGNQNSVGIENCVYKGVDYNLVMRNLAKLVAGLLVQYGLTTTDIRQHYDFAGKDCPQVLRQSGRWAEQLELIELEYYALTELQGLQFEWTSLTPEYLDDTGKVVSTRPNSATKVAYKVKVSGDNYLEEFSFESTLKAITFKVE